MNLFISLLFFLGLVLIIHGVYEDKYKRLQNEKRIEYRFVPRTYYEEQLNASQFSSKFSPLFNDDSQWYHRNIGREMGFDRKRGIRGENKQLDRVA